MLAKCKICGKWTDEFSCKTLKGPFTCFDCEDAIWEDKWRRANCGNCLNGYPHDVCYLCKKCEM